MPEKEERPADEELHASDAAETDRPEGSGDASLTDAELEETAAGRRACQVSEQPEERAMSVAEDDPYPTISGVTPLPDPPFSTQP